jgi:hypothetical protein
MLVMDEFGFERKKLSVGDCHSNRPCGSSKPDRDGAKSSLTLSIFSGEDQDASTSLQMRCSASLGVATSYS